MYISRYTDRHRHTHTHTHTHTHARTHTRTHTHAHAHTHTLLYMYRGAERDLRTWKTASALEELFLGLFCYLYMYCEELSVLWRNVFFFIFSTKILRFSFYFLTYICIYSVALNGLWKNNMFRCIVWSMT